MYRNVRAVCYNPPVMSGATPLIGLDGFFLSQPTTGSGQYTVNLWRELADHDHRLASVLLCPATREYESVKGPAQRLVVPARLAAPKSRKLWWEQRGVLRAARLARASLLHVPYFSAPRYARLPVVTTIHDVIPLLFPEYGGSPAMQLYLRLVSAAARRARLVLTDSDCSRRDITRLLGIPEARIRVVPLAADERFVPDGDPAAGRALRQRYGLDGPVVFNVGGLDVRKNLELLIEAFARALPRLDPATRLVIAGRAHSGNPRLYPPLEPVVRRWGVEQQVVFTGTIDDEEKIAFYRLADLYAYPSRYEGFGLTPLEAMACGTPVLCADASSLPEVVGSGGLLVEPKAEPFAAALVMVLSDPECRADLARRALNQARRFSWRRTAELTRAAYGDALAQPPAAA